MSGKDQISLQRLFPGIGIPVRHYVDSDDEGKGFDSSRLFPSFLAFSSARRAFSIEESNFWEMISADASVIRPETLPSFTGAWEHPDKAGSRETVRSKRRNNFI